MDHAPDSSAGLQPGLHPFHVRLWPKSIIHPEQYDGRASRLTLSWDLGRCTAQETKKVVRQWCQTLPTLQHLRGLVLWSSVNQALFDAACEIAALEYLQLKSSSVVRLDAIARLGRLRCLHLGSSTKLESIAPLASLGALEFLEIENVKLISDFSPLLALQGLQSLSVTGSMWTAQSIGSLAPFAAMTWLQSLSLSTEGISSLRPLAALTGLKVLNIGGRLPMEEYAWLAAHLPNTQCRWFAPYFDLADTGIGRCKRCGGNTQVMLTGKGKGTLCRVCDAARVQRHEAAFAAAKAQASAAAG